MKENRGGDRELRLRVCERSQKPCDGFLTAAEDERIGWPIAHPALDVPRAGFALASG